MSDQSNDNIIERAWEVMEEITSDPASYDKAILKALRENDLDKLRELVTKVEADLAVEHFHSRELF